MLRLTCQQIFASCRRKAGAGGTSPRWRARTGRRALPAGQGTCQPGRSATSWCTRSTRSPPCCCRPAEPLASANRTVRLAGHQRNARPMTMAARQVGAPRASAYRDPATWDRAPTTGAPIGVLSTKAKPGQSEREPGPTWRCPVTGHLDCAVGGCERIARTQESATRNRARRLRHDRPGHARTTAVPSRTHARGDGRDRFRPSVPDHSCGRSDRADHERRPGRTAERRSGRYTAAD